MSSAPPVPMADLKAQYTTIRQEVDEAVARVLASQHFILGPEVAAFETEISAYCETPFAIGCASGSDALLLALMAIGVGPGDEVLCPAYTFFATAGSIARLGARPLFADIERDTFNLSLDHAREVAGRAKQLRAVLPVDLFGQAADLDGFFALAAEHGVPVIEDAAQAIGARDTSDARTGSRAALGCFSFFPAKNLGAYGDGGMLTTRDEALADSLRTLRTHGGRSEYHHDRVGLNSRLDALQAAILRVKLRHLDAWSKQRQENAARYDTAFAAAGAAVAGANDSPRLPLWTPRPARPPASHVYNQYVIRVPAELRDPLRAHLGERGVASKIYYPLGLHRQTCFAELGYREGDLPETEAACRETLAIPVHAELTEAQLAHVVDSVVRFLETR